MDDESTIEDYKAGWISAYERANTNVLWGTEPSSILQDKVRQLKSLGAQRVLDAGCGDGRNLALLLQHGFYTVGVDISMQALGKALAKAQLQSEAAFCLVRFDVEEIESLFPPSSFDAIVCWDTFGQLARPDHTLRGFRSLLRRGGYVLLNAYTDQDCSFGQGQQLSESAFRYEGTLFTFYSREALERILVGFESLEFSNLSWQDPPHAGFRPYPHEHNSWVVLGRKE